MMRLELATAEYIGARAQQQDLAAAVPLPGGAVLVLADGLGGHESGAEASRIVVETFKEASSQGQFDKAETRRQALRETVDRANQRIAEGVNPAHGQRGMASTVVAAVVAGGEMSWVSVGDSHLYVWRGGRLAKLNEDHSQAGLMVRSGQYRPEDPEVQAVKSVLVSALTGRKLEIVDLPQRAFKVEAGDVLMLASDGLNTLDDDEIGRIVADVATQGAVRLSTVLLETVRGRRVERQDNTTVAVARVLAAPVRAEREATARTITHQVTVPTELDLEPRTERAPAVPADLAEGVEPKPAAPVTAQAPPHVAAELARPAEGGSGQPAGPAAAAAAQQVAAPPLRELPAAERTPRDGGERVEAGARPAAATAKPVRRGLEPPVARGPAIAAAAPADVASETIAAPVPAPHRGRSLVGLMGLVLVWLVATVAALAAVALVKPEWLGWSPRTSASAPAGAGAAGKAPAPAEKPEAPAPAADTAAVPAAAKGPRIERPVVLEPLPPSPSQASGAVVPPPAAAAAPAASAPAAAGAGPSPQAGPPAAGTPQPAAEPAPAPALIEQPKEVRPARKRNP